MSFTFSNLWVFSADDNVVIFFLIFPENRFDFQTKCLFVDKLIVSLGDKLIVFLGDKFT